MDESAVFHKLMLKYCKTKLKFRPLEYLLVWAVSYEYLTFSILGKFFSRRHIEMFLFFFLFFPEQDLSFHANCLSGDNLHEMSYPDFSGN